MRPPEEQTRKAVLEWTLKYGSVLDYDVILVPVHITEGDGVTT